MGMGAVSTRPWNRVNALALIRNRGKIGGAAVFFVALIGIQGDGGGAGWRGRMARMMVEQALSDAICGGSNDHAHAGEPVVLAGRREVL